MNPTARTEHPLRKTRFHTEKEQFAIRTIGDAADAGYALVTTLLRVGFNYRVPQPWIARNALRAVKAQLSASARVFEWGSGMSTLWYESHCAEVHSVEDNPVWWEIVCGRITSAKVKLREGQDYVDAISEFPDHYFDLISVDGSHRHQCVRAALPKLKPSGMLMVDNTDKDRATKGDLFQTDAFLETLRTFRIQRFVGWSPGNFFPQETTLCFPISGPEL